MKKFLPCSLNIHSRYWELFMFAHFNCLDYIIPLLQKTLLSVAYIIVKVEFLKSFICVDFRYKWSLRSYL